MAQSRLEKLVSKINRYKGKLLIMTKLRSFVKQILGDGYNDQKLYKIIYQLRTKGYIVCLKKNLYYVKAPDYTITNHEIIDQFYRQIIKKHANEFIDGKRYIGGLKALELHVMNFSSPDEILFVCENKQSTESAMFDKKILCKKYFSKGKNLFLVFYKMTQKMKIGAYAFRVANLELSILETLYSPNVIHQGYIHTLIKKLMKSYHSSFDFQVIEKSLSVGKHHSSVKRLYNLVGGQYKGFGKELKDLLRRYSY